MTTNTANPHGIPFDEDAISEEDAIAAPCDVFSTDALNLAVDVIEHSEPPKSQLVESIHTTDQGK